MRDAAAPPAAPPRPPGARDRVRALVLRGRWRRRLRLGKDVVLGRGLRFELSAGATVELGDGVQLGDRCRFHVRGGAVRIGAGAVLGERCVVSCDAGATIGARARLGDEAVVLDAVVGDGAVVGPRAVVEPGAEVPPGAAVGAQQVIPRPSWSRPAARSARP
ncbi:MAG TPA: hypothetical protein VD931_16840 [Baekduia sp.]|nr:hypothetical protein [Baekduia sp.]